MYRNNQREFLKAVLDCGDADLILLDGIEYDFKAGNRKAARSGEDLSLWTQIFLRRSQV